MPAFSDLGMDMNRNLSRHAGFVAILLSANLCAAQGGDADAPLFALAARNVEMAVDPFSGIHVIGHGLGLDDPAPNPAVAPSGEKYSNGVLTIKRLEVDAGVLGKSYYDVIMTLKALSNPPIMFSCA